MGFWLVDCSVFRCFLDVALVPLQVNHPDENLGLPRGGRERSAFSEV